MTRRAFISGVMASAMGTPAIGEDRKMKWVQHGDGTLVLEGTPMSIVYTPSDGGGDFRVYIGTRYKYPYATLEGAKQDAERMYKELVEIGAQ